VWRWLLLNLVWWIVHVGVCCRIEVLSMFERVC
jgi:hypothetical protein